MKWVAASVAAAALLLSGAAVWVASQSNSQTSARMSNGAAAPLELVLQQGDGFACTDGDGDGFADQFPLLRCENGTVVCIDADGNGLDDTYTGLRCPQSASVSGVTNGPSDQDSTVGQDQDDQGENDQDENDDDQDEDDQGQQNDQQDQDDDLQGDQEDDDSIACDPGFTHPVGERIATQYGVSYETVMGYFCGDPHYGFGEIKQAYRISELAGVSVGEVFSLRESGLGWGQVKQQYGLIGGGRANGNGPFPKDDTSNGNGHGNGRGHGHGYGHDKNQDDNEDDD